MEIEPTFSPTDPPRQGDLIAKSRIQERHPFDRFGIVVTADCDMERARADHIITYLKVVPVADYVHYVWCRKKIHRMVERLRTDVSSSFNRLWKQADPARVDLSAARFGEWLSESGPEQVCAELAGADEGAIAKLVPRVAQLSSALRLPFASMMIYRRAQFAKLARGAADGRSGAHVGPASGTRHV